MRRPVPRLRHLSHVIPACLSLFFFACNTTEKSAVLKGPATLATNCAAAAFPLPPDRVLGTLDGKPIKAQDLGSEFALAEQRALHAYCDAVHAAREEAFDAFVARELVRQAASAAGASDADWMRAEVAKRNPTPSDEAVRAFYEERKRPSAPPLEAVKEQVVLAMQSEQSERVVRDLVAELKSKAKITRTLPDVRSPPRDITPAEHTPRKGPAGAKVRVVEFADFQCPYCSMAASTVKQLHEKYGDKVEFSYRHFPLRSIHPDAQRAGEYAQCANEQGRFWEFHDRLYADQENLGEGALGKAASDVGLDAAKLAACLGEGRGAEQVNRDVGQAEVLGVQGTPTFFINGRQHSGPATPDALIAAIDAELNP